MIAIATGESPTVIAAPVELSAVWIGVTVPGVWPLTTYAVPPSGVIAIPDGPGPTGIAGPAVFVATSIGVTVPSSAFPT